MKVLLMIFAISISSCSFKAGDYRVETNTVIGKFQRLKTNPILPDYFEHFAILDNLDTIKVSQYVEIGDTIQYKYFFK